MKFTDRFLKVPISIYNTRHKELTGKEELEAKWFKFLPFELAAYRPSYGVDAPSDEELVAITLKSGDTTLVEMSPEDFEKLLNSHQQ